MQRMRARNEREKRKARIERRVYISKGGRRLRDNADIMYTHSQVHVQTEVRRGIRGKNRLNEGLELDVPSICNQISKIIVIDAKTMDWSVQCT